MKQLRCILMLLILLMLSAGVVTSVRADPPLPRIPPSPPLAPAQPGPAPADTTRPLSRALDLPPLTAVLIVGPIDGDYGSWTTQEKQNMELAAVELEANGVTVHRFYTPDNNWEQITAAAEGAHFVFYRGHGVYWSPMPYPTVGGFALKDDFISSDQIRADLDLAPNAIVMLYGCFTAGSSSIDNPPIDSTEAQRRVAQYSDPFFDIGVGGYYANSFGDAFQMFVRYLFQGLALGDAYESFYDFSTTTVERYTHPDHPELAMWLDKDFWSNRWQYNNAFAGLPDQTLEDLFGVTAMELSTLAVSYIAEPTFPPRSYSVSVESTSTETFTWTATVTPGGLWLNVTPLSGSSGEQMAITFTPTALASGVYPASIRVLAGTPQIENGDQTITITLYIVDQVHFAYLPLVRKP
jgi:hypothetical protein